MEAIFSVILTSAYFTSDIAPFMSCNDNLSRVRSHKMELFFILHMKKDFVVNSDNQLHLMTKILSEYNISIPQTLPMPVSSLSAP